VSNIEESVEIEVPVRVAYNQWTQFEEFPKFMEGVQSVTQLDDKTLDWVVEIGGQRRHWKAEITEQSPDERIAWTSREGDTTQSGVVTFHRLSDNRSKIMLQIGFSPEGVVEKVGDMLGIVRRRAKGDLQRFKEFIESRGRESGAWRGEM
jgi:uncharacterized membrane protein